MTAIYKAIVLWLEGFLSSRALDKCLLLMDFCVIFVADNVTTDQAVAMGNGINISWDSYPNMTCGYIVKWCHSSGSEPCSVDWQKFPSNTTNAVIKSGKSEYFLVSLSVWDPEQQVEWEQREAIGCRLFDSCVRL